MNNEIKIKDDQYIAHTYKRFPICIVAAKGCVLTDDEGKKYLDFTSGIGVNSLGHNDTAWKIAINNQLNQVVHTSNLYYTLPDIEVAKMLCEKSHMSKVFFANSGAEANEGAIKVARKYAHDKYGDEREEIITLVNSFHGRTITTLTATAQDVFHKNFGPFTQGFRYCEANNIASLKQAVNHNTMAVMLEMVQGEGGVIPLNQDFVDAVVEICQANDLLLIIDEVQTGIGRCGDFFAYMHYGIHPDIVSCAKGLGGGLPIGAVLMNDKTKDVLNYGDHGTTFGGNPLICAGASVVLKRIDDHLLSEVNRKAQIIRARLSQMPHIKQVNGLGLMMGIEFEEGIKAIDVLNNCMKQGVLFLTAKTNLRLLPPLVISDDEINHGMDVLEAVLNQI